MRLDIGIKATKIEFDEDTNSLYQDGTEIKRDARVLGDMREVLMDGSFIKDSNKKDLTYFMFRSAGMEKAREVFDAYRVRHDITVMAPYRLGNEYNKTFGHYHPEAPGGLGYPELYEVISGKALFIMQKRLEKDRYDIRIVRASSGDKVLMPPDYGHITVNTGRDRLILANLVNSEFSSDYEPIRRMHGAGVYITRDKETVVNPNYKDVSIKIDSPAPLSQVSRTARIYDSFVKHPSSFEFLAKPELLAQEQE